MRRVVVLGGLGLFGRTAADELRRLGIDVQTASRRAAADLQIDANDRSSIQRSLRAGDVVIDAAGPFHARSPALVESAIEIGFDVIDINDNLEYAERIIALETRIASAGIRVLSSASTVSAVSAAVLRDSGVAEPRELAAFLVPASRHTANVGAALSLIDSVGRPVRVHREGRLQARIGWDERSHFLMPDPIGKVCGWLFESADSVYLPRIWPSLREVVMYVDSNTPGVNWLLRLAAHSNLVRNMLRRGARIGTTLSRWVGSSAGGIGYGIEDANGIAACYAIFAEENSFLTAVAPTVLAARALIHGEISGHGLILPDRHVEPEVLFAYLRRAKIAIKKTK